MANTLRMVIYYMLPPLLGNPVCIQEHSESQNLSQGPIYVCIIKLVYHGHVAIIYRSMYW